MMKIGMPFTAATAAILIVTSLAVHSSVAMPLSPYQGGVEAELLRSKRSSSQSAYVLHDYVNTAYNQRTYDCLGYTGEASCTPVSTQLCHSQTLEFYHTLASHPIANDPGCELSITTNLKATDYNSTTGVEISFYKKREPVSLEHRYYIFILTKQPGAQFYSDSVLITTVDASCCGWQTFDVSRVKSVVSPGVTNLTMQFVVFEQKSISDSPVTMTCEEIESVFILDRDADFNRFPSCSGELSDPPPTEKPTDPTTDAKSEENSSVISTSNDTEMKKEEKVEEVGSGEGMGEEEVKPMTDTSEDNPVDGYLPTVTFLIQAIEPSVKFTKRSVDAAAAAENNNNTTNTDPVQTEEENDIMYDGDEQGSGFDCQRLEKKLKLSDIDASIVKPEVVDVGECSSSTESMQCLPSSTVPIQILKKDPKHNTVSIEVYSESRILTCEPHFVTTQAPSTTATDPVSTTL